MRELSRLHILIIEDDVQSREVLRYILQAFGVRHITMASNGAEGLQKIENAELKMDAILCDWNMPCMTGLALLKTVRQKGYTVPFVIISGRQDFESVTQAKEAGVSAYIPKPISPGQLEQKLRTLFQ